MHTKIVATLGPASLNPETMRDMVRYGVRIFRLNFSHAAAAYFEPAIKTIRALESEFGVPLTAMADLCGPKTRIGEVDGSPRTVAKGESLLLGLPDERPDPARDDRVFISLDMPELLAGLRVGMPVNLSDGLLQFHVTREVKADRLYEMEAQNAGLLSSNKGIAFPGKHHPMPEMSKLCSTPSHFSKRWRILAVWVSAPKMIFLRPMRFCRSRFCTSSASSSAMEAVAPRQVGRMSSRSWRWISMLAGPTGTAMAPKRSHPSWNPAPAVHRP